MTDLMVEQRKVADDEDAERRSRFPLGSALTLEDMEEAGREHLLDDLREREPISWVPSLNGWLVTSRSAAREVLGSQTVSVQSHQNMVRASLGRLMLTVDSDEHRRMRAPFERPFKPGIVESFTTVIQQAANSLLDDLVPDGAAELGDAFAAPFAVTMAAKVLGLSLDDVRQIARIYSSFADAMEYDGNPEPVRRADLARDELNVLLHENLRRTRQSPDHSVTSAVSGTQSGLGDDEIVAQLRVIMFGAIETVQASIMNTLLLLLTNPEQFELVRADPSLLVQAGEEARRLIPPVAFVERWTSAATVVGGVEVPANEFIGVSVLAANRDPATFENPLAFDVRRTNSNRALTFSFGEHACLGLHLARLETTIALQSIIERMPQLQLTGSDEPTGFAFRRPQAMHLTWATS